MSVQQRVTLTHVGTGREVPVEQVTVFGRNDLYYRYTDDDERGDRLDDVADGLASLNYIKICSDSQISRTHGLLDPSLPGISDLNSTNGVKLNGRRLPNRYGQKGPLVELADGDLIALGRQRFRASVEEVTVEDYTQAILRLRSAFVGSDTAQTARANEVLRFLGERKGFAVRPAVGWPAVIANFYHLQSGAHADGLAVIVLIAGCEGPELIMQGERFPFGKLMPLLNGVPGRKVFALEAGGDPSACEQIFKAQAFEDSVLVTAAGNVDLDEPVLHTVRSNLIQAVRDSLHGESVAGVCDDVVDGLDALIAARTNVLQRAWIAKYRGRISVMFGEREREVDEAISHSLRFGSTTFRF